MASYALLSATLECGVPLAIADYQARGGPSTWDVEQARAFAGTLGAKGDHLLYGGKETAALVSQLCYALAVLAFSPGGARFLGQSWEAQY